MLGFWSGFKMGFSKAWDLAVEDGKELIIRKAKDGAIKDTLNQVEKMVEKRVQEAKDKKLVNLNQVIAKREEFRRKKEDSNSVSDAKKYGHYLEVIDWMIQEHGEKL